MFGVGGGGWSLAVWWVDVGRLLSLLLLYNERIKDKIHFKVKKKERERESVVVEFDFIVE